MNAPFLASDRVLLLLSLVPYLREHGPTSVAELATTFDVNEGVLRKLIGFLGTAGIPGETLSYQHNDLFDIDWDAFETDDVVSLTHTVAIDDSPRFTGAESAALLAGLLALRPMLAPDDAALADALGEKLRSALELSEMPAVAIESGAADPVLTMLVASIESEQPVTFSYRNAEGVSSSRTVQPTSLTEREGLWYLQGFSAERGAERTFRVAQISDLQASELPFDVELTTEPVRESEEIRALIPERLLPTIRGFAPEVVRDSSLAPGYVLVRIEAWHAGAAVRLAQHGPGTIEIVSPPAARAAVSEWAESALATLQSEHPGHDKSPER